MNKANVNEVKRRIIALLVFVVFVSVYGCAPKTLTPAEQKLYVAISVLDGLHAFQSAAIDANKLQLVSDADSVQIVKYTRAAAITVGESPAGWQATLVKWWDELTAAIPMDRVSKSQTLRILWSSIATLMDQLRKTPAPDDVRDLSVWIPATLAAQGGY